MSKKNVLKISLLLFLFVPFFGAEAQQYQIMEAIPGVFNAGSSISFPDLVSAIYKFGIWTVGIAALFMITVGGFMYATSAGNTSSAGTAKTVITDALLGLAVALTAYFVLNFINPDLVKTNALTGKLPRITPAVQQFPVSAETTEMIKGAGLDSLAQQILSNKNIVVQGEASASCSDESGKKVSPQSNLEEIKKGNPMTVCNITCVSSGNPCKEKRPPSKKMLQAILTLAQSKSFTITSIAGGQHGKPSSVHYSGAGIDIVPSGGDWNGYVATLENNGANKDQTFCEDPKKSGGSIKSLTCTVKHHIHASFY